MRTYYKFSSSILVHVFHLLMRKEPPLKMIPVEDIAQEIEIVYFQNSQADIRTLVKICRRSAKSLLTQYGYSRTYPKGSQGFCAESMTETELNNWSILDAQYLTQTGKQILMSYNVEPSNHNITILSRMCGTKVKRQ